MRRSVLVVVAFLSVVGCKSQESAPVAATEPSASAPSASASAAVEKLSGPPLPAVTKWTLDPENSSAEFVCKHVLSKVRGMFHQPSGTVVFDDATPANSKVNATIDARTITTGVEERDTHLKSPDFFNVAKYPTITFASTGVTKANATTYSVTGDLTMHGVTKPVTLAVTASAPFEHAGGVRRGVEATATVNRKDFGLVWEYPGEGPGVVVGNEIKITIDAELVLEPGAGK